MKPENILLHDNLQVKILDFGISKLLSPKQSILFTTLRGTRSYLAPKWLTSTAISDKIDVYSYGMVLLEIVKGIRNNCNREIYFPLFALKMHEQGKYLELADPRLEGRVRSEEIEKLVQIALCCMHKEPVLRPAMAGVVGMLEAGLAFGEPRVESLNYLRSNGGHNEFVLFPDSLAYISSQQVLEEF